MATPKAVTPIRIFWIILTVAATSSARSPSTAPAAATAPVASIVPPSQAPPSTSSMPTNLITAGNTIIMITVKDSDMPIARDNSSFLALHAAAVAIAAETPHTDMSAEITIFNDGEEIFSTFWPKINVLINTIGVTTQATKMPGTPSTNNRLINTSAPNNTKPVLM